MRILVVSQIFYPTPFRVNDLVEALVARGHEVKVLTGLPDYGLPAIPEAFRRGKKRRETVLGAEVVRLPTLARGKGVLRRALNYISFACLGGLYACFSRDKHFDVIFSYETSPIFQVIPAIRFQKRSKKPLLLYCLDLWPESLKAWHVSEKSPVYRLVRRISRRIYQAADRVAVSSPGFNDYLTTVCRVEAKRLCPLPQHAEEHFASIQGRREPATDIFHFLYAGNIGAVQLLDLFVKAVPLMQTAKKFILQIVGDGSEAEAVRQLAKDLKVEQQVHFYDRRPVADLYAFYLQADCFVLGLAADNEIGKRTLPGKLQSYMSAGKPVLVMSDGAPADFVENHHCGYVVRKEAPAELAAVMDRAVEDREGDLQLGKNAYAVYQAKFTKDKVVDQLEEYLTNWDDLIKK